MSDKFHDITGQQRTHEKMVQDLAELKKAQRTSYDGSGGDGMEPRIAKLEAGVEHLQTDVSSLKDDMRDVRDRLTAVEVKVDHLPSKGFIVTGLIAALTLMALMFGFADQLQIAFESSRASQ